MSGNDQQDTFMARLAKSVSWSSLLGTSKKSETSSLPDEKTSPALPTPPVLPVLVQNTVNEYVDESLELKRRDEYVDYRIATEMCAAGIAKDAVTSTDSVVPVNETVEAIVNAYRINSPTPPTGTAEATRADEIEPAMANEMSAEDAALADAESEQRDPNCPCLFCSVAAKPNKPSEPTPIEIPQEKPAEPTEPVAHDPSGTGQDCKCPACALDMVEIFTKCIIDALERADSGKFSNIRILHQDRKVAIIATAYANSEDPIVVQLDHSKGAMAISTSGGENANIMQTIATGLKAAEMAITKTLNDGKMANPDSKNTLFWDIFAQLIDQLCVLGKIEFRNIATSPETHELTVRKFTTNPAVTAESTADDSETKSQSSTPITPTADDFHEMTIHIGSFASGITFRGEGTMMDEIDGITAIAGSLRSWVNAITDDRALELLDSIYEWPTLLTIMSRKTRA